MSARRNNAFTLTEMLVVIAIIGVLVSLLLPAIQAARESARRTQCLNNLRQSAKAIITYESKKGFLPAARTYVSPGVTQNWVVPVLAMLDRQDLADAIRMPPNNGDPTSLAGERIAVLLCPNDPDQFKVVDPVTNRELGALCYRVNGGRADAPCADASGTTYQNSDFLANGLFVGVSVPSAPPAVSVLGTLPSERKMTLNGVKDGSSSTIMLTENIVKLSREQPSLGSVWAIAGSEQDSQVLWFPDGGSADSLGLNKEYLDPAYVPSDPRRYARPSSYHPGGFCIAYGDETTRFMNESVDYAVYAVLMTSNGDKARDPSGSTAAPDPVWQAVNGAGYPGTKF